MMPAEKFAGWAAQLTAKQMDCLVTFADMPLPQEETGRLWEAAAATATAWHAQYWNAELPLHENLRELGVTAVRTMSPIEEMAWRARALYDPNSFDIAFSVQRVTEIMEAFSAVQMQVFSREEVEQRIIAHEAFHHIEETKTCPLNEMLSQETGWEVPLFFRDVGAYAFVNAVFPAAPCQFIDLAWMAQRAPRRLQEAAGKWGIPL